MMASLVEDMLAQLLTFRRDGRRHVRRLLLTCDSYVQALLKEQDILVLLERVQPLLLEDGSLGFHLALAATLTVKFRNALSDTSTCIRTGRYPWPV